MKETLTVSGRGQITLPAVVRKRFGLKGGDVVILEDRGNELVLRPGTVVEVELYTDEQIAAWDAEDTMSEDERAAIVRSTVSSRK